MKSAQENFQEKKYPQAIILSRVILDAEPENQEAITIVNEALDENPEFSSLIYKKKLGSNMTDRIPNKNFSLGGRIALYLPNRILDFIDLMSLEIGGCFGAGVKFIATEYVGLGAQASGGEGMVGLNRRHLSARGTLENFGDFFPFEARSFMEGRGYTGGAYSVTQHSAGLKRPEDDIYQRARDFWGVGGQVQFITVAFRAIFHPIEIYDLLAGFAAFDPLNDDIGVSKGFEFTSSEKEAMHQLVTQVGARGKVE